MPYLWTDQTTIQSYLDGNGTIQIRDDDTAEATNVVKNFAKSTAERLENESVFEIATLLSMAFESDATDDAVDTGVYSDTPLGFKQISDVDEDSLGIACPTYLSLLVAKLTASKIATVRLGASLSTFPNWVRAFKNEVYAQIQRWIINAETATITGLSVRSDFDLSDVLLKVKTREHTAEDLET